MSRMGSVDNLAHRTSGCFARIAARRQLVAVAHIGRVAGQKLADSRWEGVEGHPFAVASCVVVHSSTAQDLAVSLGRSVARPGAVAPHRLCADSLPPSSWLSILCGFP